MIQILCLLPLFLLAGCMSFNNAEVPVVKNTPPQYKPLIEMKVGNFTQKLNGDGDSRGVISNNSMANNTLEGILARWKSNGLIDDYDPIGKLSKKPDYTLTVNGYRNEDMSWFGSIFTGLTFFLIPSSATMKYDLHLQLQNNKDNKIYSVDVKDSFTIWQHIIFLPAFPIFMVGTMNMFSDLSMYSYSEFEKQGAFREQ